MDPAELNAVLDRDWELFTNLTIDDQVFEEAITVARTHRLRGADAIHLAAAVLRQVDYRSQRGFSDADLRP